MSGKPAESWPLVGAQLSGVALFAGALAHERSLRDLYETPKAILFASLSALLLLLWSVARAWRGPGLRGPQPSRGGSCAAWLTGLLGWAWFSFALSEGVGGALPALARGTALATTLLVASALALPAKARSVLFAWLGAGAVAVGGLGLVQRFGFDRREAFGIASGGGRFPFESLPMVDAPGATFGHVNMASEAVLVGVVALVMLRPQGRIAQSARWGGLAIASSFLLVGGSRAVWLAGLLVAASAALCALVRAPQKGRLLRRLGGLALAGIVLVGAVEAFVRVPGRGGGEPERPSARVLAAFDPSSGTVAERLLLWRNTLVLCRERPWLGGGPGSFPARYLGASARGEQHPGETLSLARQPRRPHNEVLHLASEIGWVGVGAVLAFGLRVLLAAWRGRRWGGWELLAPVAALGVVSLAAFPFRVAWTAFASAWLVGLVFAAERAAWKDQPREPRRQGAFAALRRGPAARAGPWICVGLALALLVLTLVRSRSQWRAEQAAKRGEAQLELALGRGLVGARPGPRWFFRQGQAAQALLATAVLREPQDLDHLLRWSRAADDGLGGELSRRAFSRVLELSPQMVHAHLGLVGAAVARGDLPQARAHAEQARELLPQEPAVHFALGSVYARMARLLPMSPPQRHSFRLRAQVALDAALARGLWAPDAGLARLRLTLEQTEGRPLSAQERIGLPALIERIAQESSRDPERTRQLARFVGAEAFASLPAAAGVQTLGEGPAYGPQGNRTRALWKRLRSLAGASEAESRAMLALLAWRRAEGGDGGDDVIARRTLAAAAVSAALASGRITPELLVAQALLFEAQGEGLRARGAWAQAAHVASAAGRTGARWRSLRLQAAAASLRLALQ